MWTLLAAWIGGSIVLGLGIGALVARYRANRARQVLHEAELDVLRNKLTTTLICLHNTLELLEAISVELHTNPAIDMAAPQSKVISQVISRSRQVLALLTGPNPVVDHSHLTPTNRLARWPFTNEGKLKL